jgi:hypothetical protein
MSTITIRCEELLTQLNRVTPCGDGFTAACPGHNDFGNHLFVQPGSDGTVESLECQQGCSPAEILRALRLDLPADHGEAHRDHDENDSLEQDMDAVAGDDAIRGPHSRRVMVPPREVKTLPVDRITVSDDVRPREIICAETVEDYATTYRDGALMPPIDVIFDEATDTYRLGDGRHRFEARRQLGMTTIDAVVHVGDHAHALLFAAAANLTHGRRRERGDSVEAAKCAFRGLVMKSPKKRPTHKAVMAAAHVGKETVIQAIAELEKAGIAVGPKDRRGGNRGRFGTSSTKTPDELELKEGGGDGRVSAPLPPVDRRVTGRASQRDPGRAERTDAPSVSATQAPSSRIAPTTMSHVRKRTKVNYEELLGTAVESVVRLANHDPITVAKQIDPAFLEQQLTPAITQITAWHAALITAVEAKGKRRKGGQA